MSPTFGEAVGALMAVLATGAIIYLATLANNEQAVGALIAVVAAAAGYFLRAKVQPPS